MKRIFAAIALVALSCGAVLAFSSGAPVIPNVYGLSDTDHAGDNNNMVGKQRAYPDLANTIYIVTLGQSRTASNSVAPATPYVVTNRSTCLNLNPYTNGAFFVLDDPILGASASVGYLNAGWHGKLCDALKAAGWRSGKTIAFIPIAIAGSSVSEWKNGAAYGPRIAAVAAMLTARGITPEFWHWQQGQTDCIAGMSQAAYASELRSVISYERSLSGRSGDKWYITRDSIHDANVSCAGILAAQVSVGGDTNNTVGPNMDAITTSPTNGDGTHTNDTGNTAIANAHATAYQANYP